MKNKPRRLRWPILYALLLTCYTAFTLLDAFVIPQNVVAAESVYSEEQESGEIGTEQNGTDTADQSPSDSSDTSGLSGRDASGTEHHKHGPGSHGKHVGSGRGSGSSDSSEDDTTLTYREATDTSYESDTVSINISTVRVSNTDVHIADVVLKDSSSLRAGLAEGSFGRNLKEKTSEIASENGAILAINGDYYGFRDTGYVMRNGQLYRDTPSGGEDLVLYQDGSMKIIDEDDVTAAELQAAGAVQIFSFGPGLIEEGKITVDSSTEVEQSMRSNPRSAIGQIADNHYVFVVSDGRTEESTGLTLEQLAEVLKDLGCETAYNLDGGGSFTLWFNGEVINNPTTNGNSIKERSVSDIVYIAK